MLAPLHKAGSNPKNKVNAVVAEIAKAKQGRSDGTVLLKWAQQRCGGVVITTTNKDSRAKEYIEAFEKGKGAEDVLSEEELSKIDKAGAESEVVKVWMQPYFF